MRRVGSSCCPQTALANRSFSTRPLDNRRPASDDVPLRLPGTGGRCAGVADLPQPPGEQNEQESGEAIGSSTVQPTKPAIPAGPPSDRVEDVPEVNRDAQGIREGNHPMADDLDQSTTTQISIASAPASSPTRPGSSAAGEPQTSAVRPDFEPFSSPVPMASRTIV